MNNTMNNKLFIEILGPRGRCTDLFQNCPGHWGALTLMERVCLCVCLSQYKIQGGNHGISTFSDEVPTRTDSGQGDSC